MTMYDLNFEFPFTKVDQTRRVVTGIATADNIDPAGDIVDFEASLEAFSNWMGNIREMHQPKSVGKSLTYRPVKVPYQGQIYDGIEVEAYISKGAEDTWQKILDGTLRGFSVGGKTLKKSIGYDKHNGRRGQRVNKYFLGELSLVDNPGNPAAMLSLIKRAEDGGLEYALEKYDVFFCKKDHEASLETDVCPACDKPMDNIGEVATPDAEIIKKFAADYVNNYTSEWVDEDLIKVVNAHKSPPTGYPQDKQEYADPINFKYPLDSNERIMAAYRYYNQAGQQSAGGYSSSEWSSVGNKIVAALNRISDSHYELSEGKIKESKMEKLLNNNDGAIVADMDLTPEQQEGVLAKLRSALFGSKEDLVKSEASPVTVVVNVGEELAKAASVESPRGPAPAAKKKTVETSADAEDAADGGADDAEEDGEGNKIKKGKGGAGAAASAVNSPGPETTQARPKTGPAVAGAGSFQKKAGSTVPADAADDENAEDMPDDEAAEGEDSNGKKLKKDIGGDMDLDMLKDALGELLDTKLTAVKEEISADVDSKIEAIQKSVDETANKVDNSGALKKSIDADEEDEGKLEKKASDAFWGGVFVPFEVASTLGYDS